MKRKNGKWLPEYTEILSQLCEKGELKLADMHVYFPNVSVSYLKKKAQRLGIHNKFQHNRFPYDKRALISMTPEACFWMGFLCADGTFNKRTESNVGLAFCLAKEDEEFVYGLKDFLKAETKIGSIYVENDKYKSKKGGWHTYFHLSISEIYPEIVKIYGELHDKTYRGINLNLPSNELKLSFLLGYICGDGCVSFAEKKNLLTIGITSAAENTLIWIREFVMSLDLPFAPGFTKKNSFPEITKSKGKAKQIRFNGVRAAYLYKLLKLVPVKHMQRKFANERVEVFVKNLFEKSCYCEETIESIMARNDINFSKTF